MPYSIEFPLALPADVRDVPPHLLRNNVYRWLGPGFAEPSHSGNDTPRPFRVSTLAQFAGGASFRISLLDDALFEPLVEGIRREPFAKLHERVLHLSAAPDCVGDTYLALTQRAQPNRRVTLEFMTPTCFHVNNMAYVLPDPHRIFESYAKQWGRYAPADLHMPSDWLAWLEQAIGISALKIELRQLRFATHVQQGFVGKATFEVLLNPHAEGLHWLNTLADYAFFCGTGHKTSQGMGQTRRVRGA